MAKKSVPWFAFLLLAGGALGAFAAASPASSAPGAPVPARSPIVLTCERYGFRYEFHVPTGHEALFASDAQRGELRNVLHEHEPLVQELREEVAHRHGVRDVGDLRSKDDDDVRRLKSLGYL